MAIQFDDAVADALALAARNTANSLRGQVGSRSTAADNALTDFAGPYRSVLNAVCVAEAEDRAKLAGVCDDLATDVEAAKGLAQAEKDREQAVADWQVREDQRVADRTADPTGSTYAADAAADKKPSDPAVAPPTISAAFMVTDRVREGGKSGGSGKTSANPKQLRTFVSTSQGLNNGLEGLVGPLRSAWTNFTGSCSWVQFGNTSFVSGFERLVSENQSDALWVGKIAGLFEKAGGGALGSGALDKAAEQVANDISKGKEFKDLLKGKMSAAEVAEAWNAVGMDAEAVRALPPELLVKLTDLSGLPAWAQDAASREFLDYALENPAEAYELMGFEGLSTTGPDGQIRSANESHITVQEFYEQVQAIKDALDQAEKDNSGVPIQLIGLGNHDGALVAGMSVGDLDTASHLTVNVSGMNSSVSDMFNGNDAARQLYDDARKKNKSGSFAVVNWIGYKSPKLLEVPAMGRANSGGVRLADFLNGVHASRDSLGKQPKQLTVTAHSYGSTTAVEALKQVDFTVDRLVTYGSAGVKNNTKLSDLKVGKFYATSANGDDVAKHGRSSTTKSLDPKEIDGVVTFSSEEMVASDGSKKKATTMHDMYADEGDNVGYLSPNASAQDAITSIIATGKIKPRTKAK